MAQHLLESIVPLLFLLPLWFVLVRIGKFIELLNNGHFGKTVLAFTNGLSSARVQIIIFTLVHYIRHLIDLNIDKGMVPTFFNFVDEHFYYFISLFLLFTAILKISETYKEYLLVTYTQEELQFNNLNRSSEKTKIDATSKCVKGVLIVISFVSLLGHFGVPASSILAFGGMGSLIIGFAAKDLLSDVLSGVLLYFDKQFNIGDWIKIENPSIEGNVESIGWRVSKIKTFDNRPIYVPNKFLGTAVIQNVSRRESMRFKETLTLDLGAMDAVDEICTDIRESIFLNHDDIDTSKTVVVNLSSLTGGVINIYISAHTKNLDFVDYYNIKQDIWLNIYRIINQHNSVIVPPYHKFFQQ